MYEGVSQPAAKRAVGPADALDYVCGVMIGVALPHGVQAVTGAGVSDQVEELILTTKEEVKETFSHSLTLGRAWHVSERVLMRGTMCVMIGV